MAKKELEAEAKKVPMEIIPSIRVTKLSNGYLAEEQKKDDFGSINSAAMDLEGALELVRKYFAD